MTNIVSPSPILECFVRRVKEKFPVAQQEKTEKYEDAIESSNSTADHERARGCALWSILAANDKHSHHPRWGEIKELHKVWKDTWFGVEFGLAPTNSSVGDDVRIQWTEAAVDVALKLAEEDGWESSRWEALLAELIDMAA